MQDKVEFLGHQINFDGITPIANNILKINKFAQPQSQTQLQSFLGLVNYYRNYVPNIAQMAAPLYDLLGKNKKFQWSPDANTAFDTIKNKLTSGVKLFHPDPAKPFILHTDSSDDSISGILSQKSSTGVDEPLMFISKKLNLTERLWPISHKELSAVAFSLQFLRNLILGSQIFVIVDHYNLINMYSQAMKSPRMIRLAIKISEFAPDLYFQAEKDNICAYYLSRCFVNTSYRAEETTLYNIQIENNFPLSNIKTLQNEDPFCVHIRNNLEGKETGTIHKNVYETHNDILYIKDNIKNKLKVVIPRTLTDDLIKIIHEDKFSAHPGIIETINKIKSGYYWPNLNIDVNNFVRKCIICNTLKSAKTTKTKLTLYTETNFPFSVVAMDLVGPLNNIEGDKNYILTIICRLTRFTEAIILNSKSAEDVAFGLFTALFSRHSYPNSILSDLGSEFTNSLIKILESKYNIRRTYTVAYNPQSTGLIEAFNKTLGKNLRILSEKYTDWPLYVQTSIMAYNSAIHSTTGKSPFFAIYFRDPNTVYSNLNLMQKPPSLIHDEMSIPTQMIYKTREIFLECAKALTDNEIIRNDKVNNNRKDNIFSPGDLVYMINVPTTDANVKLQAKWTGPYRLIEKISKTIYFLESLVTGKIFRAHSRRIRLAHGDTNIINHPNAKKYFPVFIDIVSEDDNVVQVSQNEMISDILLDKQEMDNYNPFEKEIHLTTMRFLISHNIWVGNDRLNISVVDALEITPTKYVEQIYKKCPSLNIHHNRKQLNNTTVSIIGKFPTMGSTHTNTVTRHTAELRWVMIKCLLINSTNKIQQLLCSKLLNDAYKQTLLLDTPNNRISWLLQGLDHILLTNNGNLKYIILHIPENFPLSFNDKTKLYGKLKQLAKKEYANPVINFHP